MACLGKNFPLGHRRQEKSGYVGVKTAKGWRLEHRVVMERVLGRKLRAGEIVHHKDLDTANNDPSNLVLCKNLREHMDIHHAEDLKNPPTHHFGRRKWGPQEYAAFYSQQAGASEAGTI